MVKISAKAADFFKTEGKTELSLKDLSSLLERIRRVESKESMPKPETIRKIKHLQNMIQVLKEQSTDITLGYTDLGEVSATQLYRRTTPENLKCFSEALDNVKWYMEWEEFESYGKKTGTDWSEVMYQRFDKVLTSAGTVHFNLTGITKDEIAKIYKTDPHLIVGAHSGTGWTKAFGKYSITHWELAQVLHNPALLGRTRFYLFDASRNEDPVLVTPEELKTLGIKTEGERR